jgi:NAD(P)-dependent dehydrogenase (short-subunit alcohol dehydrogenase family)
VQKVCNRTFGPSTTTEEVLADVDLSGRTVLVTGGSGGLGFETSRSLAAAGASVILADLSPDRGAAACERIRAADPRARVTARAVDLADPSSVRSLADALRDDRTVIDLLVNNAGIVNGELRYAPTGWEATLAVNFLGHFLLTGLLMPCLLAASGPGRRIVNLSSGAHRHSPVHWDDPHFLYRPYTPRDAYAQSKTADALFTRGLQDHLGGTGIEAYTVRPAVSATGIYQDLSADQRAVFSSRVRGGRAGEPAEVGAATTVWACVAAELAGQGGAYLAACSVVGTPSAPSADGGHADWIFDAGQAQRLWRMAEVATDTSFDWTQAEEGLQR